MKILLVSPYFIDSYSHKISMGSAVKLAFNLKKIAQVTVLTSGRKKVVEIIDKNLKIISSQGVLIPDPINYMISFQLLRKFWQIVSKNKPDVVVVSKYMFFSSLTIILARIKKIPVVTVTDTFPGINWFPRSQVVSGVMWLYARIIGLPLLWLSNRVVLLHEGLENLAKKYRLNFVMIHNGVESKYFKKLTVPRDLKKPLDEFWVGFVGRPESVKGYDQAVKMANDLKSNKKIKFIFVCGGEEKKSIENRIHLGFRKDLMGIYQMFDVLILPSWAEGLPNVVMEAMSQGVTVIANNVGGVNVLIKNRQNGLLIDRGDQVVMEKQIEELYNDSSLVKKLGMMARETIIKDYNLKNILKSYQELFKKICAA